MAANADLSGLRIDRDRPDAGQRNALKWVGLLVVIALAFVTAVYAFGRRAAGTGVTVTRVQLSGGSAGSAGITANGYVVARTRASVSSRITGRLATLSVEEGSVVRRGQVMASLENADYRAALSQAVADSARAEAALLEAEAARDQLNRDLTRARALVAQNVEAARVAEELEAQLAASEARVAVQRAQVLSSIAGIAVNRANFDNTYIRAPFDGTVLRKDAEVGEVVAPVATGGGLTRGAVVTMADLESLEVEVDVNEAYIAQVTDGQPARIVLDAYPTAVFAGMVRQIVPTADRQRATVQVKVSITDRDPRILPEMGARVEFLAEAEPAVADAPMRIFIPASTVRTEAGETYVWVVRDGRSFRASIDAGPVSGGSREVRSGLTGGENIVLDPPSNLEDGGRVNVVAR